jgi:hypothetical protein
MKTIVSCLSVWLTLSLIGCTKDKEVDTNHTMIQSVDSIKFASDSFLPMNIGNYWLLNNENYTRITGTIRIDGNLFYEFYSLIGGDAIGVQYLRIDENNNLIEKSPNNSNWNYLHAKFNSNVGDTFYTLNDKSINDCLVSVIYKNTDTIKFAFDNVYHPTLKGQKYFKAYIRGVGFEGNWSEVRINKYVYRFNSK